MTTNYGLLLSLLAVTFIGLAGPPAQTDDNALQNAIDAREAARDSRNLDAWSRLTTDDYTLVDESGMLHSKAQ